jgi:hypothetical protein
MSKIYIKEITNCGDCPNFKMKIQGKTDGYCMVESEFIESHIEIPIWCPLKDKKAKS